MFYIGTKVKGDRIINQIGGPVPDIETAIDICDSAVAERKMTFRVFDATSKDIKYVKKVEDLVADDSAINVKVVDDNTVVEPDVTEAPEEEVVVDEPETTIEPDSSDEADELYVNNVTEPYTVVGTSPKVCLRSEPRVADDTKTGRVMGEHKFSIITELVDKNGKVIWVETSMKDWINAEYIQKI